MLFWYVELLVARCTSLSSAPGWQQKFCLWQLRLQGKARDTQGRHATIGPARVSSRPAAGLHREEFFHRERLEEHGFIKPVKEFRTKSFA